MRLAFAVSIHVDADILLVDEALAVGDIAFRQRCMHRIHEMRERGLSILFVSHSSEDVRAISDRCLWLEQGSVQALGTTDGVVGQYLASMTARDAAMIASEAAAQTVRAPFIAPDLATTAEISGHRFGDGTGMAIVGARPRRSERASSVANSGASATMAAKNRCITSGRRSSLTPVEQPSVAGLHTSARAESSSHSAA